MKSIFWKVWGVPIGIGIASTVGLISALTGDGFYDLLSWATLGFPVAITIWYLYKPKKQISTKRSK